MKAAVWTLGAVLLAAGLTVAQAAPNIPASEMPGRERQRFQESPVERYTDPLAKPRNAEPLWQWECDQRSTSRNSARRAKRSQGC